MNSSLLRMKSRRLLVLCCLLPALVFAIGDPVADYSKAGTDGPHVFYRGRKIVVKSLIMRDTNLVLQSDVFAERSAIDLSCRIPESNDEFSFKLKNALDVSPTVYPLPEKMLVLSDIEGNFQAFKLMLKGAGVIDDQFKWSFGNGHVVFLGDFFDRGLNVTEVLWLIYKMEDEAEAAGGKVHYILGNHEVLNLQGNTQYVRRKYLENTALLGEEYSEWFGRNSELGRWLRTKNAVEKIGDYVFCHGGISVEMADSGMSLEEINTIARRYYGVRVSEIDDPRGQMVFNVEKGVFWFRQAARNRMPEEDVTKVLAYAGASRMVIGHTLVPDVTSLYSGRVLCVDLYHDENLRNGFAKTLYIENGRPYGLDSNGEKSSVFKVMFKGSEK
jgi:hypothetical protein